jgi:fibronectin type 3 domain-containing protein
MSQAGSTDPLPGVRKHRAACAIALGLSLSGCAVDFSRWYEAARKAVPEAPELSLEPTADLPAPEGLRAASGELRVVPLQWEPLLVGDIDGYVIERAPERDGPFEPLAKVSGRLTTTYLDRKTIPAAPPVSVAPENEPILDESDTRQDGITWFYRIRAYSSDGAAGSRTSSVAVATTATPPEAPEDLRAYSRQPRAVPLSWRASTDPNVIGYRVERSPTASGPFELLAMIDGRHQTIYVDRGLGDLRVFYYRVVALNAAGGLGDAAEPVRAVTKPEPLPPIGLHTIAQWLGANEVAWDPNVEEDIVGYRLYRAQEGQDAPILVASLNSGETTAIDAGVAAGQRVSYTLVAIDRDGLESDPANPIEVESESYGLSATVRPDGVHLEWKDRPAEGFRGAHVFRTALLQNKNLGFAPGNSFVDTNVRPGATYRYTVVLEKIDQSVAPRSAPIEISIPDRPAD